MFVHNRVGQSAVDCEVVGCWVDLGVTRKRRSWPHPSLRFKKKKKNILLFLFWVFRINRKDLFLADSLPNVKSLHISGPFITIQRSTCKARPVRRTCLHCFACKETFA